MKNLNSQTILTIALSFFIVIGAGHGIGCIGMLEMIYLVQMFTAEMEGFSLALTSSYDESLSAVALFALFGHVLLLISMLIKPIEFWTKALGLILLWVSFYYLTHNIFNDTFSKAGFITGLPFLIVSMILGYSIMRHKISKNNVLTK